MRVTAAVLALSTIVLATACGGGYTPDEPSPAAASVAAVDPAGSFDFVASQGGQTRNGMLVLARTATGWTGQGTLEGEGEAAIVSGVTIEGNRVVVSASLSNGPVTFDVNFVGNDSFAGSIFAGPDEAIDVTGTRRVQ